jgi:hypothetical protein
MVQAAILLCAIALFVLVVALRVGGMVGPAPSPPVPQVPTLPAWSVVMPSSMPSWPTLAPTVVPTMAPTMRPTFRPTLAPTPTPAADILLTRDPSIM